MGDPGHHRRSVSAALAVWVCLAFAPGCKRDAPGDSGATKPTAPPIPRCTSGACCGQLAEACPAGFQCLDSACLAPDRVYIPASPFWMGCSEPLDTQCDADERPGRYVSVPAFIMGRREVTRAEYARCVAAGRCTAPRGPGTPQAIPEAPVVMVDWYQARDYCRFAGGRLPTEAEWEKAARGGCELYSDCRTQSRVFPWSGQPSCDRVASVGPCSAPIGAVGSRPAGQSPYGVLDLAGSVWEWVEDCSHPDYRGAPTDGSAWVTPCRNDIRIDRGGRNGDPLERLRVSNRSDEHARSPVETVGIRCVWDVTAP